MKRERIIWIDYLKIVACMMVMIGHFFGAFYSFCSVSPNLNTISRYVFKYFPMPFLNGNFWVCVFCILSGVLVSKKVVHTWNELFKEMILRYFRFFIPLLVSNFVVYLIDLAIGFQSHSFAAMYKNAWLNGFFNNISLRAVVKNSLILGSGLNGPLWMLRPLFIGNLVILVTNFLVSKYKIVIKGMGKVIALCICVLMAVITFKCENCMYILATYVGMVLFETKKKRIPTTVFILGIVFIMVGYYIPFIDKITTIHSLSFKNFIFSTLFVYDFLNWKETSVIRPTKLPIGAISFWVYLLHWPIICSFSSSLVMAFENFTLGYWLVLLLTVILVCLLAYFLVNFLDKLIDRIISKLKFIIDRIFCIKPNNI